MTTPTRTARPCALAAAAALALPGASPWAAAQSAPPAAAAAATAAAVPDPASERAGLQELRATTLALIEALVEQGLLPRAKADELIRKAQQAAAASGTGAG